MADSKLKTFAFILYGVLTFLLLCAVLVLIFKEEKSCTPGSVENAINRMNQDDLEQNGSDPAVSKINAGQQAPAVSNEPGTGLGFTFQGRYELYDSQNFDEFLSELGIGYFKRLAATRASSEYQINKSGNKWSLRTVSTFGESLIEFVNGVPFKEDRLDGQTVDSVINIEGNVWKQTQKSDPPVTIDREFFADKIKVTSTVNGVASVRLYKRL